MDKKLIRGLFLMLPWLASCQHAANSNKFGAEIDTTNAVEASSVASALGNEPQKELKVVGKIAQVCQAEGCWFKYDLGQSEPMLVRMKDHSFTIPKDLQGKTAIVEGIAHYDTTSVEKLRDYAKDEGQSDAEVAAIVNPEVKLVIEAKGVVLR